MAMTQVSECYLTVGLLSFKNTVTLMLIYVA